LALAFDFTPALEEARPARRAFACVERVLDLVRGQPLADRVREVDALGTSRSTAYRIRQGLEAAGLVVIVSGEIHQSKGVAGG
jgi:hypothetical protein